MLPAATSLQRPRDAPALTDAAAEISPRLTRLPCSASFSQDHPGRASALDGAHRTLTTNRASDKSICHLGGARGSGYLFQATPLGKRSGPTAAPESSANGKLRPADEPRPPNFPFARYRGAVGRNASQRPRKACNNSAAALAWELFRHFLIECQTDFSGSARGMISSRSVCAPRDQ